MRALASIALELVLLQACAAAVIVLGALLLRALR